MSNDGLTIAWAFLRAMVTCEQHLVHQVSRLETSLFNVGVNNHHERIALNGLSARCHKLLPSYRKLLADYGRLKDSSSAVYARCTGTPTLGHLKEDTSHANHTVLKIE
jgi:hypothetical protein